MSSDSAEEIEREESGGEEQETNRTTKTKLKKTVGKKKRAPRDKNAPKRAGSAYLKFASSIRKTIKENNPTFTFAEITRAISEQWKSLSETDKAPFLEMQRKDKERYDIEKAQYDAKLLASNGSE